MLVGILAFLLYLGSGADWTAQKLDGLEDRLKSVVVEKSELDKALDVVGKLEKVTKTYVDADSESRKRLLGVLENYESTAADLQNSFDADLQRRLDFQQQAVAARFALKATLSRDEWTKVFAAEKAKP